MGKFSRRQIDDIFLIFPRKQALIFHANCLLRRQFACNIKAYFLGKIRKNISKCCLLRILPRMLSVKKLLELADQLFCQVTLFPVNIKIGTIFPYVLHKAQLLTIKCKPFTTNTQVTAFLWKSVHKSVKIIHHKIHHSKLTEDENFITKVILYYLIFIPRSTEKVTSTIKLFVCVEVLRPSQPNGIMSSAVSLPNHTLTGQA